jgi:hypothetical protein
MRTGLFRLFVVALSAILTWVAWDYFAADRLVLERELDNLYVEPAWVEPVLMVVVGAIAIGIAIVLVIWVARGFRTAVRP